MTESSLTRFFRDIEAKYDVTEAEYRAMYYAQGGVCLICRKAKGRARRLGVDHDHVTGEVRALLCTGSLNANTCNRLIALYTRPMLLRAAGVLSDPPPARAVLAPMRAGAVELPFLAREGTFKIGDVRGLE